jgi:integrase
MRKRHSGKNTTTYEIQYRRDGYDISACGKTIELAKANMIEKIRNAKPKKRAKSTTIPNTFNAFAFYFFENFRKERISSKTYHCDINRYNKYLQPAFQERPLRNILPSDCKKILDNVQAKGMGKTADELYSLMTIIFKGAIAHGIIERNPLNMVLHTQHERESGIALLRSEEDELFSRITEPTFRIAAALALYCGLRPNELSSAKINGSFIVAINSKRKHGKTEYKKIPICKKLRPFLENGIPDVFPAVPAENGRDHRFHD